MEGKFQAIKLLFWLSSLKDVGSFWLLILLFQSLLFLNSNDSKEQLITFSTAIFKLQSKLSFQLKCASHRKISLVLSNNSILATTFGNRTSRPLKMENGLFLKMKEKLFTNLPQKKTAWFKLINFWIVSSNQTKIFQTC